MHLRDLLSEANYLEIIGDIDIDIKGLSYDSRRVRKGDLFFCIKGLKADGHRFAEKAEKAGAIAAVVENIQPDLSITQVIVGNTREAMARMASTFYRHPTKKLKLVGITGTNGKTTTSFMTEGIFTAAGQKTGLLGTIEYRIGDEKIAVSRTTPESLDLQALFANMVAAGVETAVIEVSSHAIDLLRVEACNFDVVVFTNLSQDHLDYHGTIDAYFEVKKRIFDATIHKNIAQVINIDDEYGSSLIREGRCRQLRYSTKEEVELNARNITLKADGSSFVLISPGGNVDITLKLPGYYNVYNALAAAGAAVALGIDIDKIKEGLESLHSVPGRFERVNCGQDFSVIVDYAHTPDSLEKIIIAARQLTERKLITVFGCGGDRDRGKRPAMGRIAVELSDYTIITSDNPRNEEPLRIIKDIKSGINELGRARFEVEEDRRLAIKLAIEKAGKGDIVVIAGKGHEQGQEIADKIIPFDDVEVVRELLGEMMK